jgi:hypothetical protein
VVGKDFFFEKKEAKNFWTLSRALRLARTAGVKVFCFFFFKKEDLAFVPQRIPNIRPTSLP